VPRQIDVIIPERFWGFPAVQLDDQFLAGTDIADALQLIMKWCDLDPYQADSTLREGCNTGKVRAKHRIASFDGKSIGFVRVRPEVWDLVTEIDADTSTLFSPLHGGTFKDVRIHRGDLKAWLSPSRRGPAPGAIGRYAADDRALFSEIDRIMKETKKSVTEAVRQLDYKGNVKGRGTSESHIRRVVRLYTKERLI
jgi:hypothetical protein